MGIRRKPQMEKRLSTAIQRYHDHGPMFLVELEDEVERLRDQIGRLKSHVAQKDSTGDLKPAASGLGARLVAGLRG